MTVTANSFRLQYQEFADDQVYPDTLVNQYLTLARMFIIQSVWGDALDYGISLWTAHNIAIAGDKLNGGDIFGISGPKTGAHVGEVGYTSNPQFLFQGLENIGYYARSSYGIQFWQLAKMFGAGGLQV